MADAVRETAADRLAAFWADTATTPGGAVSGLLDFEESIDELGDVRYTSGRWVFVCDASETAKFVAGETVTIGADNYTVHHKRETDSAVLEVALQPAAA